MPIIAEELSSTVVTVCLGSIGFYTIKALVENLSKYSNIFGGNYKLLKKEKEDDSNNDSNDDCDDDSFNAPISTTDSMSDNAYIEIDNIENNLDIDDIITD